MSNIDEINDRVLACCTLYNLCIDGDRDQDFTDDDDDDDMDAFDPRLHPIQNPVHGANVLTEGKRKRQTIMQNL